MATNHNLIEGETFIATTGPWGLYLGPCTTSRGRGKGDIFVACRGAVFKTFKDKITKTMAYDHEPEFDVKV